MDLVIRCPNGRLEYPSDALCSSPYIKGTLIEKHFFGDFSGETPLFLPFLFDQVSYLVDFIRVGTVDVKNLELLEYLVHGEYSSLNFAIHALRHGYLDIYGFHIEGNRFNLSEFTRDHVIYDPVIQIRRRERVRQEVRWGLENFVKNNSDVRDYLVVEDFLSFMEKQREINVVGNKNAIRGKYLPNISWEDLEEEVVQMFVRDLDQMEITWYNSDRPQINIPNRRRLDTSSLVQYHKYFTVEKNYTMSLELFIRHVFRYNPLKNKLIAESFSSLQQTSGEKEALNEFYTQLVSQLR